MELTIRTTTGKYIAPTAEQRHTNAEKMRAMQGKLLAEQSIAAFSILPDHDTATAVAPTNFSSEPRQAPIQRPAYRAMQRFIERHAPTANLQAATFSPQEGYFLAADQDERGFEWAIADHDEYGNAAYVWRRDTSPVGPDIALSTTRQDARAWGCTKIIHPANMHNLSDSEIDDWYDKYLLGALTD